VFSVANFVNTLTAARWTFGILNELYVYVYFETENVAPLVNKHTSIWSLN